MCYQWELVELAKKIEKIEDEEVDYRENRKWIKYRKRQEDIYEILRKENQQDERNLWENKIHRNTRLSKKLAGLS